MRSAVILVILAIQLALSWGLDLESRNMRLQHDDVALVEVEAEAFLDADIAAFEASMAELRSTIAHQQALLASADPKAAPAAAKPAPAKPAAATPAAATATAATPAAAKPAATSDAAIKNELSASVPIVAPPPPAPPASMKTNVTKDAEEAKKKANPNADTITTNYGNRESYPPALKTNFTVYETIPLSGVPVHSKKVLAGVLDKMEEVQGKMEKLHGLNTDIVFRD